MTIVINTRRWRRAMEAVRRSNGWKLLKDEKGWAVETVKPLGKPGRHLLKREQDAWVDAGILPAKDADGTLNSKTQAILIPPLSMGDRAVAYAMTQVGVHETPWGSNRGHDVERYQRSTGAYGKAWCASFFWYCWQRAGYTGPTDAGAWHSTDNYGTRVDLAHARPGDGVSFNTGAGHIGLYLGHDPHAGTVRTVDGNTNDQVAVRDRTIRSIHSICRPLS